MAELALAIVPIFFGAVRGFSIVREKTHMLRHYHKEIRRLRDKVDVQSRCFRGEIYHLIIDTLDDHTAQLLIRDDNDARWKSQDVEHALSQHLQGLCPDYCKAIDEIKSALTNIQARLSLFAAPDVTSPLFQATRDRFRLMFKKDEYKEDIKLLKEWIAELKRVRKLAHKSQARSGAAPKGKQKETWALSEDERLEEPNLKIVKYIRTIRRLSSGLQSLMQRHWSCSDDSHSYHVSRLFIGSLWQQDGVLWLLEASGGRSGTSLSNRFLFHVASQQLGLLTPESHGRRSFDEQDSPRPKKPKTSPHGSSSTELAQFEPGPMDDIQTLCRQLEGCALLYPRSGAVTQVHLETRERFRFDAKDIGDWEKHNMSSAAELFGQPADLVLNRERVQLALALVRGTMANHSTSAWPQGCILEGVSYLQDPHASVDVSAALRTLSVQVRVGPTHTVDMEMDDASFVSDDDLEFTYGIRNQILWRLGVALLSIGLWTKIDWREFAAVRRKAAALDSLGEQYRDVVRRLIWGDFGLDTRDLSNENLQVEILRTVVEPLEERAAPRRRARACDGEPSDGVYSGTAPALARPLVVRPSQG